MAGIRLTPKAHRVPSGSTFGWAVNGTPSRPSPQDLKPRQTRVSRSSTLADPPSHRASSSPWWSSTEMFAVLRSSGPRIEAGRGTGVPNPG